VGSAPFFAPMGFVRADPARIVMPGPVDATRFLGLALGLDGLTALAGAVGAPR
jgi:predicted N-acetyltransferase YhbS